MKLFIKSFLLLCSIGTFIMINSAFANVAINKKKINGPECTSHLMKVLKINSNDAYQICSSHSEEVKLCLIQNKQLRKNELLKKCQNK